MEWLEDIQLLILDLDDTIFQTNSMNPEIFTGAFNELESFYQSNNSNIDFKELSFDLWSKPIDVVFEKYDVPESVVTRFYNHIEKTNYQDLMIKTFPDYHIIRKLTLRKVLVTTGLKELQNAKINALNIKSDFESIYIDDPRDRPRTLKYDIFRDILRNNDLDPQKVLVIGDNPDSEIKAANKLGMRTIQRLSKTKMASNLSDIVVNSFYELNQLFQVDDSK